MTHKAFTEVTCVGTTDAHPVYKERKNPYGNPFRSEVAFFKTSEGWLVSYIPGLTVIFR